MRIVSLLVIGCSILVAACDRSTTSPTDTIIQSETFSGTLSPGGLRSHVFRALSAGPVNITLTKAGPPDDIVIGLGVGTPTADSCPLVDGLATAAGSVAQLVGGVNSGGNLCVAVFDLGNGTMTADIEYSVKVTHP